MASVSFSKLPANMLLPGWIAAFKGELPDIDIAITTLNSREAFERLLRYEADMAVVGGGRELPAGLSCRPLMLDELRFIVPGRHELAGRKATLARLLAEPFVVREEGSSGRELLLALCRLHGAPATRIGLQVSGTAETIKAVAAGYGAAIASALEVRDSVSRGEIGVVTVDGIRIDNPIGLYVREGERRPRKRRQAPPWAHTAPCGACACPFASSRCYFASASAVS
ncbi:LysR substrate-binding domain-containing protein [Paenibacillus sp. GYB003]